MDLSTILAIGSALLSAAIAVLVLVAPKTKTTADDAVLARLEQLEALIKPAAK